MFAAPSAAAERGIGAHNVKITKDYVKSSGVCSCSLMKDRIHHTRIFKNYCPNCHSKGSLNFEQGSASWTSPEGLWYCTRCDMDYCLVHGKSHDRRGEYLIPTKEPPVPNAQKVNAQFEEEEYIEVVIYDNKYKFKKQRLKELKESIS